MAADLAVYRSESPRAACVLGHGAGAGQHSPFMVRFAKGLAERGVSTATFDFPYMAARRGAPDKPAVLEAAWRSAVDEAKRVFEGLPLFIGGKSMGGRIASHIASQGTPGLAGLFFLGYPLHPPGAPDKRRDAHLPAIAEPMLFVQGTRDAFGTREDVAGYRLSPAIRVAWLEDGDHSWKPRASSGRTEAQNMAEALTAIRGFLAAL